MKVYFVFEIKDEFVDLYYENGRRFIMKKIIKTGIAVGTVMIFVQIGNLIYAEENPIQNTEYVVESENVN